MSQIKFKEPIVRQVSTTTRHISPEDVVYSIGPLVNIEKRTNTIYITAHFLEHIKKEDLYVPSFVTVNKSKIQIYIHVKSNSSEVKTGSNLRSHWEIVLEQVPKALNDYTELKDLKEIYVHIDFNEDNLKEKMEAIKSVLNEREKSSKEKIKEIKKIVKPDIGDPKRGTRVIPT